MAWKKLKNHMKYFKKCYFFAKWTKKKDEIIKTLLEMQTSILETVSNPSVVKEEEVSPTRNEIQEIQWLKKSSGKKNKKEPRNIYIGNLSFDTKIDDLYLLFGLRSTKYLRETCKINMSVNEKTGKCKGSAFALVPDYVQKEIPKLNGITLENRIIVMKMQLLREEIRKICKKT